MDTGVKMLTELMNILVSKEQGNVLTSLVTIRF
jgi:hypothetical protein